MAAGSVAPGAGSSPGSDGAAEGVGTPTDGRGEAPAAALLLGADALGAAGFGDVLSGVEAFLPTLSPLVCSAAAAPAAFPAAANLLPSAAGLPAARKSFGAALPAVV